MQKVNIDRPICSQCSTPLQKTEAFFAGQDIHYAGSVCMSCQMAFCVKCLKGTVDRCPVCGAGARTAYRKALTELNAAAPQVGSKGASDSSRRPWWKLWN